MIPLLYWQLKVFIRISLGTFKGIMKGYSEVSELLPCSCLGNSIKSEAVLYIGCQDTQYKCVYSSWSLMRSTKRPKLCERTCSCGHTDVESVWTDCGRFSKWWEIIVARSSERVPTDWSPPRTTVISAVGILMALPLPPTPTTSGDVRPIGK